MMTYYVKSANLERIALIAFERRQPKYVEKRGDGKGCHNKNHLASFPFSLVCFK